MVEWMRTQEALLPRLSPQVLASVAGAVCDAHADRKHVNAAKRLRKYAGVLGAVRCQHCAETKRSGRVDHTASVRCPRVVPRSPNHFWAKEFGCVGLWSPDEQKRPPRPRSSIFFGRKS